MFFARRGIQVFFLVAAVLVVSVGVRAWVSPEEAPGLWRWPLYGVGFPFAAVFLVAGALKPRVAGMSRLIVPTSLVVAVALIDEHTFGDVVVSGLVLCFTFLMFIMEGLVTFWWDEKDPGEGEGLEFGP